MGERREIGDIEPIIRTGSTVFPTGKGCGSSIDHTWTENPTYKNRTHIHHECTICGQVRIKTRRPAWGRAEVTDDGDEPMTAADAKWHRTRDLTKMFAKLERAMT